MRAGGASTALIVRGKRSRDIPDQATLHRLLDYDPASGLFVWKARGRATFDKIFAGKSAFTSPWNGYRVGSLLGKQHAAHRIAFKYVHGRDPAGQVDHINGDRSDNRIVNLREASSLENNRNSARPSHNRSGMVGVSYRADKRKWRAFISLNNRGVHLGYFPTRDKAAAARRAAEQRLGFHPNHGRAQCI